MYEKIRLLLEDEGKTFAWLSKKSGVSQNVFSMMKKRGTSLSAENLTAVAKALRITPKKLLGV